MIKNSWVTSPDLEPPFGHAELVSLQTFCNKRIRETGVPASAEILEIWDTGVRLNDNPVVGFRLLVTRADGSVYEAETKNVLSIVHICQFQPGAVVAVKVDVEDQNIVALDVFEDR